uniref:Magnetosome protein Mad28-2 n=1 Tax=Candidatus Magnetananas rongchengensis TaxID=1463558 RepID=A0A3S6IXU8_9BACT|nr:magnetosome protein Mad28-2 [Candidatus Magnetananas rongchenensis]
MAEDKTNDTLKPGDTPKPSEPTIKPQPSFISSASSSGSKTCVGLDIGTSHLVMARGNDNKVDMSKELNAFFTVPESKVTNNTLKANDIPFLEFENNFYILGYAAQNFANMFHANLRRPVENGIISPNEKEGVQVMHALIDKVASKPDNFGQVLCYSIPGEPLEGKGSVVYHDKIMRQYLAGLGYKALSVNEAMAVVMAELEDEGYTGIGVSMGGGMCNVCLSYLSVPVITYSIQKGGDYINKMAGESVGEPATTMKMIKEEQLNLATPPKDRLHTALNIFYEDVITSLISSIQQVLSAADRLPRIPKPIPIVLSGGTVLPGGFEKKFTDILKKHALPIEISKVKLAKNPLESTAKGALAVALAEV